MADYAEYVRRAMDPRRWSGSAVFLSFVATPPAIASFVAAQATWGPVAAYFPLFLLGLVHFLFFAWAQEERDVARRLILPSGWFVRDVALQLLAGTLVVAVPVLALWALLRPGLHSPELTAAVPLIAFYWIVAAPIETWLQAWVWPIVLPFGPVAGLVSWIALHGERALDPAFAAMAVTLGTAFFLLTYLRYVRWPGRHYFGPVASSAAHATWNSVLIWVAFSWPAVSAGAGAPAPEQVLPAAALVVVALLLWWGWRLSRRRS